MFMHSNILYLSGLYVLTGAFIGYPMHRRMQLQSVSILQWNLLSLDKFFVHKMQFIWLKSKFAKLETLYILIHRIILLRFTVFK